MRSAAKPFDLERLPTVAEARLRLLQALPPYRPPEEQVPLAQALGRVLAREVRAAQDIPAFARSLVDGYALRAEDVAPARDPEVPLTVRGRVRMGHAAAAVVGPQEAVWVPTGGMVPPGADAVVPVEQTMPAGDAAGPDGLPGAITVRACVRPGDNVLPAAADAAAGEVVLRPGRRLRPQDVGVLASVGCLVPWVYRRPVVAILSTGDELVPPDREPGLGQVRDANAYSLASAVQADGGVPLLLGIVADDAGAWRRALVEALDCDLVLVSGGSSVGLDDVAGDVLASFGPPGVLVHGVRMAPGKPTILALIGDRPVFGLPGNPVSALIAYDLFVRPALRWRMGCLPAGPWHPVVRARLARPIHAPRGRELHARVRLTVVDGEVVAEPLPGGSAQLGSLARADGLVTVPLERGSLPAGETVEVRLLFDPA